MNELTKDELWVILTDMDTNINNAPPLKPSPLYIALRDKIEVMIGECCDHEHLKDVGAKYKVCRMCAQEVHEDE